MKKEEPIEKKVQRSPGQQLSLLSDRIASMNLGDAPTMRAPVQLNNNAMDRLGHGSNAMFELNPRMGSRFNDVFSPATHHRRSISFGSFNAFHGASNPLQFGSVPSFSPIVFSRGRGQSSLFGGKRVQQMIIIEIRYVYILRPFFISFYEPLIYRMEFSKYEIYI